MSPEPSAKPVEETDAVVAALHRTDTGDRTNAKHRSHAIDGLRAIAALMVLVSHSRALAGERGDTALGKTLGAGVLLFFCVSGYLIAGPFIEALVSGRSLPWLPGYAVRRFARIWPAYIVAFLALVALVPPAGGIRLWQWPVHIFLLQSWVSGEGGAIYFVAWTLGLEIMFYILVPVFALAVRGRRTVVEVDRVALALVAVWVAAAIWMLLVAAAFPAIGSGRAPSAAAIWARGIIFPWLALFIPGALIALAQTEAAAGSATRRVFDAFLRSRTLALAVMAALGIAAWRFMHSPHVLFNDGFARLAWGSFYGVMLALIVSGRIRLRLVWAVLAPIGVVSYGIYLWHWIVRLVILRHGGALVRGGKVAWGIDTVLLFAFTLPLAIASWYVIERVAMRRAAAWARAGIVRREAESGKIA